jgi:hypothetical protein
VRELIVGDIVELKKECLGNDEGTEGVVYEVYHLTPEERGVSVIFENGNYDGFSPMEQQTLLNRTGHEPSLAGYQFTNVMQLSKDFNLGVFDVVFE